MSPMSLKSEPGNFWVRTEKHPTYIVVWYVNNDAIRSIGKYSRRPSIAFTLAHSRHKLLKATPITPIIGRQAERASLMHAANHENNLNSLNE